MMSKRLLLLALGFMVVLMSAGCFDLLVTPGAAVSPDGKLIYFLKPLSDKREDLPVLSLSSVSRDGGDVTAITTPDRGTSVTAFAVNPINGDVLYVETGKSGTRVMAYANGGAREFLPGSTFDAIGMGTMMRFSPDGSKIALAMLLLPPDVTREELGNLTTIKPEQLKGTRFVLYLVDAADRTLTPVSSADSERVNTFDWSPGGKRLAYTTWVDSNGDGTIATIPNVDSATMATDLGDRTQIRIYDLETQKTTAIDSDKMDYAPLFLTDSKLAYVSLDLTALLTGGDQNIMTYDLTSGSGQAVHTTTGLVTGMALSPDHQQVAWSESSAAQPTTGSTPPNHVYIAGTDFQKPRSVVEIPGSDGLPDAAVWTPDGQALVLTTSSIISTFMKQAAASASSDTSSPSPQKLLWVVVESDTSTTLYEGSMGNSNLFTTIFGLVTSGAMQQFGQLSSP